MHKGVLAVKRQESRQWGGHSPWLLSLLLNCNFPSFSSAESRLSLPCPDSRPLIINRIHTNCILYFVSLSLGSASFWLCLCSVLLYDSGCGQRWASFHVWLPNSAPESLKILQRWRWWTDIYSLIGNKNLIWICISFVSSHVLFKDPVKWRPMIIWTFKSSS